MQLIVALAACLLIQASRKGAKGEKAGVQCKGCKGKGMVVRVLQLGPGLITQQQMVCPECRGEGAI
jgi:DnaJ-class molecular chaperone